MGTTTITLDQSSISLDSSGVQTSTEHPGQLASRQPGQPCALLGGLPGCAPKFRNGMPPRLAGKKQEENGDERAHPPFDDAGVAPGVGDTQSASPPDVPPTLPPVAQDFPFPLPDRNNIYAKMRAHLGDGFTQAAMALLYDALAAVDEERLVMAIQLFDTCMALFKQDGRHLTSLFMTDRPLAIPRDVAPYRTDLLLQLKCMFFYPIRSATISGEYSLIKAVMGTGLERPDGELLVENIASAILQARKPHGLIDIKYMIDSVSPRGEVRRSKGAAGKASVPLLPGDRALILKKIEAMACLAWPQERLGVLCNSLSSITNAPIINLAAQISRASAALAAGGARPLAEMLCGGVSHDLIIKTLTFVLKENAAIRSDEIVTLEEAVAVIEHWYLPYRSQNVRLEKDDDLLKDLTWIAQDKKLAHIEVSVIVEAMKGLKDPANMNVMQQLIGFAIKLNKRGVSLDQFEAKETPAERFKLLKDNEIQL